MEGAGERFVENVAKQNGALYRGAFEAANLNWTLVRRARKIRPDAPVAQLDRVLVSEAKGHRFDSCRARHLPKDAMHRNSGSDRGRSRLSVGVARFRLRSSSLSHSPVMAMAQAPASDTGAAPSPLSAEDLDALVGRIALYPDDLVAIILPGVDLSAADRAGGPLSRQAQERSQTADRREVGRFGEGARQLSRRRQDDERRSRLDIRARRGGRRRSGRGARSDPGVPAPHAGGGQSQEQRQAGRRSREGSDQDRSRRTRR